MTAPQPNLPSPEHQDFYQRFCSFWNAPSGPRVAEIIAPDATIHFSGQGTFSGADYVVAMADILASVNQLKVTPIDFAGNDDVIYIYWNASADFEGETRKWLGVDRFRIKDGMAVEEHIIFDPAVLEPA